MLETQRTHTEKAVPAFMPPHRLFRLIAVRKCLYWLLVKGFILLSLLVCCLPLCLCKAFIGEGFELAVSHAAAMGSGSTGLCLPSLPVWAPLRAHHKGCWQVILLRMGFPAAQPEVDTSLLKICIVSVAEHARIIYVKDELQSTDPWALSHLHEMSEPECKTASWVSWRCAMG